MKNGISNFHCLIFFLRERGFRCGRLRLLSSDSPFHSAMFPRAWLQLIPDRTSGISLPQKTPAPESDKSPCPETRAQKVADRHPETRLRARAAGYKPPAPRNKRR